MTKGLILMAGSGTRLLPLTERIPKPLVEVAGRPLIARSVDALVACGVTQLVGVVGYGAAEIERYFRQEYPALSVELIDNPRYADTNNAYSLLCAREAFHASGMILLDGDILYEQAIMETVVQYAVDRSGLVVRRSSDLGDEEMKVRVDRRGRITEIGKHLVPAASIGESIGIARFSVADTRRLFETLERRIEQQGRTGEFYEASFQQMIDEGMRLDMIDAGDNLCIEIDTLEDLRVAAREVAPWVDSVMAR
jgi:choline kinase